MQKRMIIADWSFFKAGQGCFYGGQIKTRKSKPFSFVYDCGSKQGTAVLKTEIMGFKSWLPGKTPKELDLLVLSHLDADHINQIDYLLKDCNCKVVVLPYLFPIERLYLYFKTGFDDNTDDDIFRLFIQDPAAFLIERGVERVIFISGNGENGVVINDDNEPDKPTDAQDRKKSDELDHLFDIDVALEDAQSEWLYPEQLQLFQANPDKVEFKKGNGDIRAGRYWQFYFYQIEQPVETIAEFRSQINEQFGVKLEDGYIVGDDIKKIFNHPTEVNLLKGIFKSLFKDLNSTGLIVLHGPINQAFTKISAADGIMSQQYCYTLLTGDTNMAKGYPYFIRQRLPFTRILQVPHHGSKANWEKKELTSLDASHLVINYGTKNTFGHPGTEVCAEILVESPHWRIEHNTELNDFYYRIIAYIPSSATYADIAPMHLTHKPVIATQNARTVDDPEHQGTWTDVRSLSIGKVQWDDPDSFSVKVWRHVRGRWTRQSEEVPLHRALDLAILVLSAMIEEKSGTLPGHYLDAIVVDPAGLLELHEFIADNRGLLEERVHELNGLLMEYLNTQYLSNGS